MQTSLSEESADPGLLLELPTHFEADLADIALVAIVEHAVGEHQQHVLHELLRVVVDIVQEFLADCPEVHRVLDDVEVIVDVELLRVHRLVEEVRALDLPAGV